MLVDFRLARDGKVYLLEADPTPYLHSTSKFIKGARASGRTYAQTILEIAEPARARYAVGRRGSSSSPSAPLHVCDVASRP